MKCPTCEADSQKSSVEFDTSHATESGEDRNFWDEEGNNHKHYPAWITSVYRCSNGHAFYVQNRLRCFAPHCAWGQNYHVDPTPIGTADDGD